MVRISIAFRYALRAIAAATLFAFAVPLVVSGPARAQDEKNDAAHYQTCMEKISKRPNDAFEDATEWRSMGGGAPAEHCAAAALLALGQDDEAGKRLEALAKDPTVDPKLRPEILRQAAQAWLDAGKLERANAVLSAALKLDPGDPALWGDRAVVLGEQKKYDGAIDDLSHAVTLDPQDARAWLLRGSAYRLTKDYKSATRDIGEALRIRPDMLDAYLERGNLRRLQGDKDGARADWMRVIRTAPDSDMAETARANLQRMDVDTSKP